MHPSGSILIADEDTAFCRATRLLLGKTGFVCDCAVNGKETQWLLGRKRYDLLITGLDQDGDSGRKWLRNLPPIAQGMPVLVVTRCLPPPPTSDAPPSPITASLTKPVDAEELLKHVRSLVRGARAQRAIAMAHELLTHATRRLDDLERLLVDARNDLSEDAVAELLAVMIRNLGKGLRNLDEMHGTLKSRKLSVLPPNFPEAAKKIRKDF